MNINSFKYIISTGCSYGEIINSIFSEVESYMPNYDFILKKELEGRNIKKYKIYSDDIIYIDVPMRSQSTSWQADSVIYIVSKLLSLGVSSENIYTLVQWSQWSRTSYTIPQVFYKSLNEKKIRNNSINIGDSNCYQFKILNKNQSNAFYNIKSILSDNLKIKSFQDVGSNISYLDGEYYIVPSHINTHNIKDDSFKYYIESLQELDDKIDIDTKVKEYLNNILKTQNFLKQNNIRYNFFHMQSCMSGWYYDNDIIKHNITHDIDYLKFKSKTINNNHIEFIWDKYDYIFKQIDLDFIWHYNDGVYTRGGVDEYSYSKYGKTSYTHLNEESLFNLKKMIVIPQFGFHPSIIVYKTLWNKITTNCDFIKYTNEYLDFIDFKIFEDINYNGLTKNGLFISNKEFEKNISNV